MFIRSKCKYCKKIFSKKIQYDRNGKHRFCSVKCNSIFYGTAKSKKYSPFYYFIQRANRKERVLQYGPPDISISYLRKLWKQQKGICPYTKIKMILPKTLNQLYKIKSPKRASLDRIDSTRGYIKGNVEFVCLSINMAKNSFSKNEITKFLNEIVVEQPGVEPGS